MATTPWIFDFDGFAVDRNLEVYDDKSGTTVATTWGRLGGYGVRIVGLQARLRRPVTKPNVSHLVWGFAVNHVTVAGELGFLLNPAGSPHIQIVQGADGSLEFRDAAGTLYGGLPAGRLPLGAPGHVEIRAKIDPSDGEIQVWINSVPTAALLLTGLNTQNGASAVVGWTQWGRAGSPLTDPDMRIMDPFWGDADDGSYAGPWGDHRMIEGVLDRDEAADDYAGSTGGAKYLLVNERPFSDAEYVGSGTGGDVQSFGIANPGLGLPIHACRWIVGHKKSDAGTGLQKLRIQDGAVVEDGDEYGLGTTRSVASQVITAMPDGGGDLTDAGVATLRFQVENATP